ncbi:MAG: A24 family peptidase, partial [Pseudomonadota bacterium]|nr:A24 family peptidase [Pseudomonadota bacterium]
MPVDPWMQIALGGLFGLLVGSFLNVVIYRLPRVMEREWLADAVAALHPSLPDEPGESQSLWTQVFGPKRPMPAALAQGAAEAHAQLEALPALSLSRPRSRCQKCGHAIRWYENIPILSWLALRGRCSACGTPIGLRYPLVELATGLLFAWCVWRLGWTFTALCWCGFSAVLVAATLIDWDTTLLPDVLTLPLLWAGLLAAALGWTAVPLGDAVWGAAAGYLSLWSVYWGFKLLTGKEGMGAGDFKLFAALGAWFGWQALVPIILMASVIGALVGIGMKFTSGLREGGVVPFG